MKFDVKKFFILSFLAFFAAYALYDFVDFILIIPISVGRYGDSLGILLAVSYFFSFLAAVAMVAVVGAVAFEDFVQIRSKVRNLWFLPACVETFSVLLYVIYELIYAGRIYGGIGKARLIIEALLVLLYRTAFAGSLMALFPKLLIENFKPVMKLKKAVAPMSNQPGFPGVNVPGFQPQNPGFPPQDPGFQPQNQGFQPQNQGFQPQNPGFQQPQDPGFQQPQAAPFQPASPFSVWQDTPVPPQEDSPQAER